MEENNPENILLHDNSYHVEILILINKGVNLKDTAEEIVEFADRLHP